MIVVTGATGQLGRLVIEELAGRVPASQIVAAVRSPEKAADLAERGIQVREADYDRPATLGPAFEGAAKILLISGSEVGKRVDQHKAVVDAAKAAGVELLAYTSIPHADTTPLGLATEHKATEEHIRASGLPFTFLRNGWYHENYLPAARLAVRSGVIAGSARDGRIASAARADFAAAAATVLTTEGHKDAVYELTGDVAWSMPELAALVAELSGAQVEYRDLPVAEYAKVLEANGLPAPVAAMFAQTDADIADGWLGDTPGELSRLIGRPTTPLRDTLAESLKNG
ncbi:NAD(P)-dependent oxidoreductase [Microbispora rosea subsp. aerata]|nr:SDR family oxidoreductase [Microbispora rosea]GGO14594.1 NAD(P)-dependent oxidoreductase [Microbispora rosea subsp. aerata]GIH55557.1 NAD(P)-dependent oxidoreductase [Microbispora rosea subsp. aerata]GLJ86501.1 NAD(P)-dependent oxidoreductase [Microbispora rosea subsp. aerata]